jgi:hypothetical protein
MKVYFVQEDNGKCEEGLTFSFKYKRCIISVFTFIPTPHKRLNRIKCKLRNQDKFNFTVDIWGNVPPVEINLGKEIEVTSELIKFLVSVIDIEIEHEFYTSEHKELIKEWKQKNIINT